MNVESGNVSSQRVALEQTGVYDFLSITVALYVLKYGRELKAHTSSWEASVNELSPILCSSLVGGTFAKLRLIQPEWMTEPSDVGVAGIDIHPV